MSQEAWAENVKNLIWFFTKGPGKDDTNFAKYLQSIFDE